MIISVHSYVSIYNLNQLVKLTYHQPLLYDKTNTCLDNLNDLIKTTEQTIRGVS